jgi:transglutaminase-like putative cysteine protease
MLLEIAHRTAYHYAQHVTHSKNEVRAVPVSDGHQRRMSSGLRITPEASFPLRYRDYWGTEVAAFDVDGPHDAIEVVAWATVETSAERRHAPDPDTNGPGLDPEEFLLPSPLVAGGGEVAELAGRLSGGDPEAVLDRVVRWVHDELRYERGSTTVRTSVDEVLARRRGVCQDFAHLSCALLRSAGLPARYVSGYFSSSELEPGEAVTVEGHAWIEVAVGDGWLAIDPTNDQPAGERHVKVGHGRDYRDVTPVKGVYRGGSGGRLEVEVRITRLGDAQEASA